MKKYTAPTMEIYQLPQEDVVRTSGSAGGSGGSSGPDNVGNANDANNDANYSPWI